MKFIWECFFSLCFFLESYECEKDTCEEEGCNSRSEKLYERGRWQYYIELINASTSGYSSCEEVEGCGCLTPVISEDLGIWRQRGGIHREDFDLALKRHAVHYQIFNHSLYRQNQCSFPTRCEGVEHFLKELVSILPDMEFVINVHDYPLSPRHSHPLPIFSFSKTSSYYDIMYPAWSFWAGGPAITTEPRGLGRWDLKREVLFASGEAWPWEKKRTIGFFRGSRTTSERDPLILLSRAEPLLVDAQYTKNQAWRSDKDTLGAVPANIVNLEDHCQYKYLFNFRGVAASFRLRHLFLCKSLVLHVGEDWQEFFYKSLHPWVHYLPLPQDLSTLREMLEFLKAHDKIAREIAERGFYHIWKRLDMEHIICYWKELLIQYAKLCTWTVQKDGSFLVL